MLRKTPNNISPSIYMLFLLSNLVNITNAGVAYIFSGEKNSHYKLMQQDDELVVDIASNHCFERGGIIPKPNTTFEQSVWTVGSINTPYATLFSATNGTRNAFFESCAKNIAQINYEASQSDDVNKLTWIMLEALGGLMLTMSMCILTYTLVQKCKARKALENTEHLRLLPNPKKVEQGVDGEDVELRRIPNRSLVQ